jgi:hypothetical protein
MGFLCLLNKSSREILYGVELKVQRKCAIDAKCSICGINMMSLLNSIIGEQKGKISFGAKITEPQILAN